MNRYIILMENGDEYIVEANNKSEAIHVLIKQEHVLLKEIQNVLTEERWQTIWGKTRFMTFIKNTTKST